MGDRVLASMASPQTLGFIGIGTMNAAVIRGLCTSESPPERIVLGPRNAVKAAQLATEFPGIVTVAASAQEVVDETKYVVIAVLTTAAEAQCRELTFTADHTVVSLMAGITIESLSEWCAPVPVANLVRALPLPPVARHVGTTLVLPPHPATVAMFTLLGTAVPVTDVDQMTKMSIVTCTMGVHFKMLDTIHQWSVEHGVDSELASVYIGGIYKGLALDVVGVGSDGFGGLVAEQTPGGINEQGIREMAGCGVFEEFKNTMDSLHARFEGREHKRAKFEAPAEE